jgi:hypothetical protein
MSSSEHDDGDPDLLRWPRLTRFYGIGPSELLEMPRKLIDIYEDKILELQAEEQLTAMQVADHPHLEERSRRTVRENLVRLAGFQSAEAIDPGSSRTELSLGAIGIKVVRE